MDDTFDWLIAIIGVLAAFWVTGFLFHLVPIERDVSHWWHIPWFFTCMTVFGIVWALVSGFLWWLKERDK